MKITQETNEFKPITIVLETREEAEDLKEALGDSVGRGPRYFVYCELLDLLEGS